MIYSLKGRVLAVDGDTVIIDVHDVGYQVLVSHINDYEIETDTGFVDIVSVNRTIPYIKYVLKTEGGLSLECADTHIVFTDKLEEVFVKDLNPGDKIYTKNGVDVVESVANLNILEEMYDLVLSDNSNHRYYTNDILSHNTLLAKKLAKEVFGDEDALVRFDMSEYSDKTSVNKLIGASAGYIGYDEGGVMTEQIKNKKHCVILLDEIEKADKDVYNIFLQVFDEGFLTDNTGQKVDFKNTIIILTSNVGTRTASEFSKGIGFNEDVDEKNKKILLKELKKQFPPEFLNRLDDVIYFNNLTEDNLKDIIRLEMGKMIKRANNIGYNVVYTEDCVTHIFDIIKEEKDFGARPIIRAIQDEFEDKITDAILNNEYENGYIFNLTCENGEIVVS